MSRVKGTRSVSPAREGLLEDIGTQGIKGGKLYGYLYPAFSLLCLAWLALRSARKPSRLRYPCQQAAALHASWVIGAAGAGMARWAWRKRVRTRRPAAVSALAMVALLSLALGGQGGVDAEG